MSFFLVLCGQAQQLHFIYIQSEQQQPFYIKLNDKLLSSSTAGYLVIPKLTKGNYSLSIGFPKSEWPTQVVYVEVGDKDLGYLLKNFGDKGWGLFNLQTMEVLTAQRSAATVPGNKVVRNDDFSSVLADVVNTPSIKESSETPKTVVTNKEAVSEIPPAAKPELSPVVPTSSIKLLSSIRSATEMKLVYVDQAQAGSDTIEVVLQLPTLVEPSEQAAVSEAAEPAPVKETVKETRRPGSETNEPKFLDINVPSDPTNNDTVVAREPKKEGAATLQMINSDCKQLANDDDFVKVRKKMAAQKSDDKMVEAAKKSLRQKCFSTEQVRNLGRLFLSDEGRYKFFDASYPHVHDTANFPVLASEFTDAYIISRFKAMIR